MTTLLSSPMEPRMRFDSFFQKQASPSCAHDELPAEFGDRSFGSSMSLGSSFELSTAGSAHDLAARVSPSTSFTTQMRLVAAAGSSSSARGGLRGEQGRLGAALGTVLNTKSPHLAAKLSSPHYMEISPPPAASSSALRSETPVRRSKGSSGSSSGRRTRETSPVLGALPPGSAMKEDTPQGDARKSAFTAHAPPSAGGSLGRLFGTELSLSNALSDTDSSPDKEPPTKRRPASLPLGGGESHSRPSIRSALAPAGSSLGRRPNLMKSMTQQPAASSLAPARKRASLEALQQRNSDSSVHTLGARGGFPARSRSHSAESSSSELKASAFNTERPMHSPILESPLSSAVQEQGLGSYFFDPHSPEHAPAAPCSTARRPNLSLHLSSSPNSSPVKQQPRPAARNTLGSRIFEKTASSAVLPTFSQALGMSGAGPAKSSLGKRANPYARRPALAPIVGASMGDCDRALKSAYPVLGSSQMSRLTAPAPRRSMSAADHSGVLGHDRRASNASSGGERMMMLAADTSSPDGERRFPPGFDASGSPIASSARPRVRPALLRQTSKDDTSPLGYGSKRSAEDRGINLNEAPMAIGSPSYGAECMPGFGASERQGKVLPCFTAKADGLMRISPATLVDVLEGRYKDEIKDYHVIDCRFGYEYEGGHVPGAINLSTIERVKAHILTAGQGLHANQPLPPRTQSGRPDEDGNRRKTVLIFHCEFSCKRAPSLALALRHADRALQQDYPSCHFPELYILEGGYCAFYKAFPTVCQPQRYVEMDDPSYCDQRSSEISGFRKQFAPKQPFNRHRSFTFGERAATTEGIPLGAPGFGQAQTICEEESSFEDSPSAAHAQAARSKRPLLQPAAKPAPFGSSQPTSFGAANVGDTSFSSSVGDSSFEEGPSDSPCAVAARRPTAANVGALADSLDTPRQPLSRGLGGRVLQRANTSANVLGR